MKRKFTVHKMTFAMLAAGVAAPMIVPAMASPVFAQDAGNTSDTKHTVDADTLLQLFETIRDYHWSNVDEDKLLSGAVEGMLNVLNDPYTEYFTAEEYQQFIGNINQSYAGIGIRIAQDEHGYLMEEVFSGSPAEAAGLKKGDRILQVNGQSITNQPLSVVSGSLRGKEGTTVTMQVERSGQAPFSVNVTRKAISLPSLTSSLLDSETGYIRILSFSDTVANEFDLALADLQRKGIRSLVVDVRGNGGGLMNASLHIADRFLTNGTIIQLKSRDMEESVTADVEGVDLPLAILIDRNSASASELLAGSLKANHRAKLVGETSFGKGVFQGGQELPNGDILKMTLGQFYFADGSSPQKVGIKPDVSLRNEALQLPAAVKLLHPERHVNIKFDTKTQTAYVNQQAISGQSTFLKDGVRYVPLRFTLEALGTEVTWNPADSSISFIYEGRSIKLMMQTGTMEVYGQLVPGLKSPLVVEEGVSYLSPQAVKEALHPDHLTVGDTVEIED